jgi:hypothetical protein
MRKYVILIICLAANSVFASLPIKVSDEELIKKTDHILVGRIIGVDMIDANGKQITDPNSSTGPGIKSKIRLIITVDQVIQSNISVVPKTLYVPLDSFMHYSLGAIKEHYPEITEQRLILLSGSNFQPPVAGHFQRNLSEKDYFLNLYKTNKAQQ